MSGDRKGGAPVTGNRTTTAASGGPRIGAVRHRLFVDGAGGPPSVATRVVPVADWFGDARGLYQVIVEIGGVRAGSLFRATGGRAET